MAVKKEITVTIGPDGKVVLETHGFKGSDCEDELKSVEKAVGEVKKRTRTKEFYESNKSTTKVKNSSTK